MNKVIKCIQINKGNAELISRTEQINNLLNEYKPHLAVINELNSELGDTIARGQFDNYVIEVDNLEVMDGKARTGILIQRGIHYKRCKDLKTPGTSTVWLQLGYPGKKPILFQGIYRQFQRLGVAGSHTPKQQKFRWEQILLKWEAAIKEEKEILVMGDLNLNLLRWDIPTEEMNSYDHAKKPMIDAFRDRIINQGFSILSRVPTITKEHPESKESCLDLMLTNNIGKITNFEAGIESFSDHTLQVMCRSSKGINQTKKYLRIRSFKEFKQETYRENIKNHPEYIETLYEGDPNIITEIIQRIICESIQEMAPVKVIQVTEKHSTKLSEEVQILMAERKIAHDKYKETKDIEDLREYRTKKNEVNKRIAKDKYERKVKKFQKEGITMKEKWKIAKEETGQKKYTSPTMIKEGTKIHTKHKDMAGA